MHSGHDYSSVAKLIFTAIARCDVNDSLSACAKVLEDRIVKYMWEDADFPWDTESIKRLSVKTDLETALEILG